MAHWTAPSAHDRGLLTSLRVLLLSAPHAVSLHREISWEVPLEKVEELEVTQQESYDAPSGGFVVPWGLGMGAMPDMNMNVAARGGAAATTERVEGDFGVVVNGTIVFLGDPEPAEQLQGWIDKARMERRAALGMP